MTILLPTFDPNFKLVPIFRKQHHPIKSPYQCQQTGCGVANKPHKDILWATLGTSWGNVCVCSLYVGETMVIYTL